MIHNRVDSHAKLLVIYSVASLLLFCNASEGRCGKADTTKWVLPVASATESKELTLRLEKLKGLLRNGFDVRYQPRNPGCAFWLEITSEKPRPDSAGGYVIVIQHGGATLRASDLEQLDKAIDRIEKVLEVKPDGVYLPVGLLTNYRLIEPRQPQTTD